MKKRELFFLSVGLFIGSLLTKKMCCLTVENALLKEILKVGGTIKK